MNVRNFSKWENKSSYSHQDEKHLLTRRVSQINVYAVKRVFMSPELSLDMNGKQCNKAANVSPTKMYSTTSV